MKLAGANFYRYSLPCAHPLELRGATIDRRTGIVVAIHGDGAAVGYGEIAPLPQFSVETLDEALASARRCIQFLERRAGASPATRAALRDREPFPPSVRFGIECALWNLAAQSNAKSPADLLAESPATRVPVNALITTSGAAAADAAESAAHNGYTAIKLKVGRVAIESDLESVRGIRRAIGEGVEIRLDANRSWSFDDALEFARRVADCEIAYIEEPIDEPHRLDEFAARSPIPIAVDETLQDAGWARLHEWRQAEFLDPFAHVPADADPLLRAILAARAWVVKPTLVGMPLTYLAHLLTKQRRIDADLVISSSFESGLGLVALANLAACAGDGALPAGLDTAAWFGGDVLDAPLPIVSGAIDLAGANAIAARFSPDGLEEVAND
ncbi:MAG: o-succinylbenzoate synthase [Candidatus Hydrogenedentes bacterium]|nr:o-succinylbenzoate synthase [Candidatus Hydrogenedentota bacterium]